MKSILFAACMLVFAVVQTTSVHAKELKQYQAEADQYYAEGDYKKAFKAYVKLAKIGDHYSQYWVSHMYANGEGKKRDLEYAYAWSALAAQSGREKLIHYNEEMFGRNDDQDGARKKAKKLSNKYGKQALEDKAELIAKRDTGRRSGACVGSRLTCQRGSAYDAPISSGSIIPPMRADTN